MLRYQQVRCTREERDRGDLGSIIPSSQKREAEIGGIFKRKTTSVADLHGMARNRVALLFSLCHSTLQNENRKEQTEQWWFQKHHCCEAKKNQNGAQEKYFTRYENIDENRQTICIVWDCNVWKPLARISCNRKYHSVILCDARRGYSIP